MASAHARRTPPRTTSRKKEGSPPRRREPELARLRLLSVAHLPPMPRWSMPPHEHAAYHELIVVFGGVLHVRMDGQEFTAGPGDVMFYPGRRVHEEWTDPGHPVESCFICFKLSTGLEEAPALVRDSTGRVRQLIRWLYEERGEVTGPALRARAEYARALIAEWLRAASTKEHEIVRWLRGFVERNLARPITLDELAFGAGMSKYHYLRLYKRLVGCTPMEDVRATRVRAAQQLILTTNLPFKEISWRCGLGDQYHMSRLFRRLLNATPGEIRMSVRHRQPLGDDAPGAGGPAA